METVLRDFRMDQSLHVEPLAHVSRFWRFIHFTINKEKAKPCLVLKLSILASLHRADEG